MGLGLALPASPCLEEKVSLVVESLPGPPETQIQHPARRSVPTQFLHELQRAAWDSDRQTVPNLSGVAKPRASGFITEGERGTNFCQVLGLCSSQSAVLPYAGDLTDGNEL